MHPDELSDEVKIVFESTQGCVKLSTEVLIKQEAEKQEAKEHEQEAKEPDTGSESLSDTEDDASANGDYLVFGEPDKLPFGDRTNSTQVETTTELTAEEQLRMAQERIAKEKEKTAVSAAKEKAAIAADIKATAAKLVKRCRDAVDASKERADEVWQAKLIFASDVPAPPLPAYDFKSNATLGGVVLIPAQKYPTHALKDAAGREQFMGWAGKLVGYERGKLRMKVKISGDSGYEHLAIKGSGAYALEKLIRLV